MLQRAAIDLDVGVRGAIMRIALGVLFLPALRLLMPEPSSSTVVVSFLSMLFALKAVAAVGRRVVPAADVVRSRWQWRRNLASQYDSFQWRKLLWFGIGFLGGACLGAPGTTIQWVLGGLCCLAGCVAELSWRRHGLGLAPPGEA